MEEKQDEVTGADLSTCMAFLEHVEMTSVERILAVTMMAYSTAMDRSRMIYPVLDSYLRSHLGQLTTDDLDQCGDDLLVWVALVLLATTARGSEPRLWAGRVLSRNGCRGWSLEHIEEKFLPIPDHRTTAGSGVEACSP